MYILQVEIFFLILARITGFIVVCPVLSYKSIPVVVKVSLSLILSFLVYSIISPIQYLQTMDILLFAILVFKESIFGLIIGYIANMIFVGIQMAGQMIDFQIGFSMGVIYDPTSGNKLSIFGRTYYWITAILFFTLDCHYHIIYALIQSFKYMQINQILFEKFQPLDIINMFSEAFAIGFQIAAPIIIVLLLSDLIMGLISRTIPQLNVLILGLPTKTLLGMLVIFMMLPLLINSFGKVILQIPNDIERVINLFS